MSKSMLPFGRKPQPWIEAEMFHAMVYKLANGLSKLDVHGFMGELLSTTQIGHPGAHLS